MGDRAGARAGAAQRPPAVPALTSGTALAGLLLAGVVLAGYLGGVLVPYLVNDLHRVPLAEVASGAHDPKDIWPTTAGPAGALLHLAGLFSVVFGPVVLPMVAVAVAPGLFLWRRTERRPRTLGTAAVVLALLGSAVMWSRLGQALMVWTMD